LVGGQRGVASSAELLARQRAVSLPPVLEPVADLRQRQPGLFGQQALLLGRRVPLDSEAVDQRAPRTLLATWHDTTFTCVTRMHVHGQLDGRI